MTEIRIFSDGGGIQSIAVLAMQALGMLDEPFDVFVFANVGNDSENPGTLSYRENYAIPFAARHRIQMKTVQKTWDGKPDSIYRLIYRTPLSQPLPMYKSGGTPDAHSCSVEFKAKQLDKWCKPFGKATVGIGISTDEFKRARSEGWHTKYGKRELGFQKRFYQPLLHVKMTRNDCIAVINQAGLPIPPRSSCWFCPVRKPSEWIEMKKNDPELFQKACDLESHINTKRGSIYLSDSYVTLHRYKTPLHLAVADQPLLPGFEPDYDDNELCNGYCGL